MAVQSTQFSVGRDVQAVLIAPNGVRIDLTNLTDFDVKPQYKTARCEPLNRPPVERSLPAGHNFTFNIDRRDATNDQLFTAIEAGWWASGSADLGTGSAGSLFVYITETNQSTTVEQYAGVSVKLTNKGSIKQDGTIKQTIEGFASQKVA